MKCFSDTNAFMSLASDEGNKPLALRPKFTLNLQLLAKQGSHGPPKISKILK